MVVPTDKAIPLANRFSPLPLEDLIGDAVDWDVNASVPDHVRKHTKLDNCKSVLKNNTPLNFPEGVRMIFTHVNLVNKLGVNNRT